jgi:hypothetical protein
MTSWNQFRACYNQTDPRRFWGRKQANEANRIAAWIEVAERARFCQLAVERLERPVIDPAPTSVQSLNVLLATLRNQLCVGDAHPVGLTPMRPGK